MLDFDCANYCSTSVLLSTHCEFEIDLLNVAS